MTGETIIEEIDLESILESWGWDIDGSTADGIDRAIDYLARIGSL